MELGWTFGDVRMREEEMPLVFRPEGHIGRGVGRNEFDERRACLGWRRRHVIRG